MASRRKTLYLGAEIKKQGKDFGLSFLNKDNGEDEKELPWYVCQVEYPLTSDLIRTSGKAAALDNASRFELIHIHVNVLRGPYQGGTFILEVDLREVLDYPNDPPKCRYITQIWHPNVHKKSGMICHSHLRGPSGPYPGTWNPMLRIQPLVTGILGHLNPEDPAFAPLDPLNTEAASQLLNNEADFLKQAKDWTKKYAVEKEIPPENLANYE